MEQSGAQSAAIEGKKCDREVRTITREWPPPAASACGRPEMVKRLFATGCRFPLPAREGVDQGLLTEIESREPQGLQDSIGP